MNRAPEILSRIEELGGYMASDHDGNIYYRVPKQCMEAVALVEVAKTEKQAVLACLLARDLIRAVPDCSADIQMLKWELKKPPISINSFTEIVKSDLFARTTLRQLGIALSNPKRWVGWSVPQLVEHLEQVGVTVAVKK